MKQRVKLKLLLKFLDKTDTYTYTMLKDVYGHACLSRTEIFESFKRLEKQTKTMRALDNHAPPKRTQTFKHWSDDPQKLSSEYPICY